MRGENELRGENERQEAMPKENVNKWEAAEHQVYVSSCKYSVR